MISDWAWRLLVVMTFIGVVLWLLSHVKVVAIAFIIGLLVTALLHPFVAMLNRRSIPRLLSTTIVFVLGLAALAGLGTTVELVGGIILAAFAPSSCYSTATACGHGCQTSPDRVT